jgi:antitoxin YefM
MLLHRTGVAMRTLNYAEALAGFEEVLDSVIDDREEVVITRDGRGSAVIVSLDEYEAVKETVHLLRSPANAQRLLDAMGRLGSDVPIQETNILLALREAATVGGVEVVIPPRADSARPVDLS